MLESKKYKKGEELYRDKAWLKEIYWGRHYSCEDIGYACSVSKMTICRWLRWHGLGTRTVSEAVRMDRMGVKAYFEKYGTSSDDDGELDM